MEKHFARSSRPTPGQVVPGGQISISRSRWTSGGQTVSTSSSWKTLPPPLSLGGHFCHSTTAKKTDSVLMSMNAAATAAAAVTSADDDGEQS